MTLTEILAALVILGVLVSAVTIARGRVARQWAEAQRRLEVASALDRIVAAWVASPGDRDRIPVPAQGALPGVEGFAWRTRWVNDGAAAEVGAGVVRVEVTDGRRVVLTLDLLKHIETREEREAAEKGRGS